MFKILFQLQGPIWEHRNRSTCLAAVSAVFLLIGVITADRAARAAEPGDDSQQSGTIPADHPHPTITAAPEVVASGLLPDLEVLPPRSLRVEELAWKSGGSYFRFGNYLVNTGEGPLELWAELKPDQEEIWVSQWVYRSGEQDPLEIEVGRFVHHPAHDHWHLDNFVLYELYRSNSQGELLERLRSSGKTGYCLVDSETAPKRVEVEGSRAQEALYQSCRNRRQGLSVGWVDIYHYWYAGQSLEMGTQPFGIYALRSVVDPDNIVREADENNNEYTVYFLVEGSELNVYGTREELLLTETVFDRMEQENNPPEH
jgi:hypothetical protein